MRRLRWLVPDVLATTSIVIFVAVASQLWTSASGKVLATQMSARVVETQYGKLRGVLVTLSNRSISRRHRRHQGEEKWKNQEEEENWYRPKFVTWQFSLVIGSVQDSSGHSVRCLHQCYHHCHQKDKN